jgi:hypothetical protein
MTTYQPATLHSQAIMRPFCTKCGTTTRLSGIEAEKPGHELRTFECPKCHHIETRVGPVK